MKHFLFCLTVLLAVSCPAAQEQLPNLPDPKPSSRFKVTDITWPSNVGDAEICLWKDDKLAPVSFTVDDNSSPDVPWWLEMADKYGFKVTWFIISKNVGGNGVGGTWDLWKDVLARGHDVQSHTHTHLHIDEPGWKDIEWEYAESKKLIEENLPGHRVRFLAYPGGPNSKLNDEGVAAKYYAGARWATGTLLPVDAMPYMGVRAITEDSFDNPKANWANFKRVLDPADKYYRTWGVYIYHGVKDKNPERPLFLFLAENKDKLWFSHFGETSMYAQERDTATLKVTENSSSKIVIELSDRMSDETFDYPLTIKVRLPDGCKAVAVEQAGKTSEGRVLEHDGKSYALVDVIPDKGPATLSPK